MSYGYGYFYVTDGRAILGPEFERFMKRTWQTSEDKGFHTQPTTFTERLMLIVSELVEAMEEHRNGHDVTEIYYVEDSNGFMKPEGVPIELADALIRIAELCELEGMPILYGTNIKMDYNDKRDYLHGKKF